MGALKLIPASNCPIVFLRSTVKYPQLWRAISQVVSVSKPFGLELTPQAPLPQVKRVEQHWQHVRQQLRILVNIHLNKLAIVGTGSADKAQVEYMVQHLLGLESKPEPDHAADALAAAICFVNYDLASFGKADAL